MEIDLCSNLNGQLRFKRILAIREALAQGTYHITPDQVAEALLQKGVLTNKKAHDERSANLPRRGITAYRWN